MHPLLSSPADVGMCIAQDDLRRTQEQLRQSITSERRKSEFLRLLSCGAVK